LRSSLLAEVCELGCRVIGRMPLLAPWVALSLSHPPPLALALAFLLALSLGAWGHDTYTQLSSILHLEPSTDASSLLSDDISSIQILFPAAPCNPPPSPYRTKTLHFRGRGGGSWANPNPQSQPSQKGRTKKIVKTFLRRMDPAQVKTWL